MNPRAFTFLQELAGREGVLVRVRGRCMEPLIVDGAIVRVQRRRFYLPGDVIVFATGSGELAAHRVLGYRRKGIVTKGDHCTEHDAPVPRKRIIGAVEGLSIGGRSRVQAMAQLARIVVTRLAR